MTFPSQMRDALLCRRYAVVVPLAFGVSCQPGVERLEVQSLLGVARDGSWDLLALGPATPGDTWAAVAADVYQRGLERVDVIVDRAQGGAAQALASAYPRAIVVPSPSQAVKEVAAHLPRAERRATERVLAAALGLDEPAAATGHQVRGTKSGVDVLGAIAQLTQRLSPLAKLQDRQRNLVVAADQAARSLSAALAASFRRHGPFHSGQAALDFTANALLRAERRFNQAAIQGGASQLISGDALQSVGSQARSIRPNAAVTAGI